MSSSKTLKASVHRERADGTRAGRIARVVRVGGHVRHRGWGARVRILGEFALHQRAVGVGQLRVQLVSD